MDPDLEQTIAEHLNAARFDEAATIALKTLGPQILGYISATLRDDDAGYEVFGTFSEQLWKSITTFRGDSSFKTWAYKLVMHAISRYRRDGFRRRGQALLTGQASAIAEAVRDTTPKYKQTAIKDSFARLRESLEPDEQTLLFLRVDQGLSWNDTAAVMSEGGEPVEPAALRKRFERAKAKLKKLAEDAGLLDR